MQIVCPACTTSYDLKPDALGASGRSVRCVRCRNVWFATPNAEPVMAEVHESAGDEPVANNPAPESNPSKADEVEPAGEFDWSFSPESAESETSPPGSGKASEAAAAENAAQDAVDALWSAADSEPIAKDAPSLVPAMEPDAMPAAEAQAAAEPENIETVAARRAAKSRKPSRWKVKWPRPGMPAAILALAAILAGLIIWRSDVVRAAPQTASLFSAIGLPVNLRGLVFENVRTTGEVHEGVPVLIVEGTIANATDKTVEVPRLRFALRNRAEHEIYAWTSVTGRSVLAPGETAAFRTRLASPPPDGRDVIVRFFNRRDFLAGMR